MVPAGETRFAGLRIAVLAAATVLGICLALRGISQWTVLSVLWRIVFVLGAGVGVVSFFLLLKSRGVLVFFPERRDQYNILTIVSMLITAVVFWCGVLLNDYINYRSKMADCESAVENGEIELALGILEPLRSSPWGSEEREELFQKIFDLDSERAIASLVESVQVGKDFSQEEGLLSRVGYFLQEGTIGDHKEAIEKQAAERIVRQLRELEKEESFASFFNIVAGVPRTSMEIPYGNDALLGLAEAALRETRILVQKGEYREAYGVLLAMENATKNGMDLGPNIETLHSQTHVCRSRAGLILDTDIEKEQLAFVLEKKGLVILDSDQRYEETSKLVVRTTEKNGACYKYRESIRPGVPKMICDKIVRIEARLTFANGKKPKEIELEAMDGAPSEIQQTEIVTINNYGGGNSYSRSRFKDNAKSGSAMKAVAKEKAFGYLLQRLDGVISLEALAPVE